MGTGRIFVTFEPNYGKHMGHVSCRLPEIEDIIFKAGGCDFLVNPHNTASLMFHLPDEVEEREAETLFRFLRPWLMRMAVSCSRLSRAGWEIEQIPAFKRAPHKKYRRTSFFSWKNLGIGVFHRANTPANGDR
jgi:hypothetical protein